MTILTDHVALNYLLIKKDSRPRLQIRILLLQEFNLEIKYRKRLENHVVDHMPCLENPPTEKPNIKVEFLYEHIYTITIVVKTPS